MSNAVVVGLQWGDEGKGKVTDILAPKSDIVVRYQGGNNAGHTVVSGDITLKLHLIPSGIMHENVTCLMGDGTVIDPIVLAGEVENLQSNGWSCENLRVSGNAHVILPYHIRMDEAQEQARGAAKIGTTMRGIGPAYCDKAQRMPEPVRVWDLLNRDRLAQRVKTQLAEKNAMFEHVYGVETMTLEEVIDPILPALAEFKDRVVDGRALVYDYMDRGCNVLFEGAQGTFLDLDHGTFPYVTSSHPIAGGACVGIGVGPKDIHQVVGVAKAYTTRVGAGIFITEQDNEAGDTIRERGREYGTTTGRPRRCGWLDAVVLRTSTRINGVTAIALTLVDVLDAFETLPVCVAYEVDGKRLEHVPSDQDALARAKPIYEELPGWKASTAEATCWDDLPENAKSYINAISDLTNTPIGLVGVGPDRAQTICLPALDW